VFFTFTLSAAIDSAHALSNVALAALCYTCTTETNEPTLHSSDYSFNRTDCAGELTTVHKTCLDGKEGLVHPCSRPIPQVVHVKSKSLCSVVQCHCVNTNTRAIQLEDGRPQ